MWKIPRPSSLRICFSLQAYFCAAFGANLVQTVMASLGLNPVMNIIALPFALVVSVIAGTTVFRNVFTTYDGFSSETSGGLGSLGITSGGTPNRVTGGSLPSWQRVTSSRHNDIPLGDFKGHGTGAISVHRVVDMEVGGIAPTPHMVRDPFIKPTPF